MLACIANCCRTATSLDRNASAPAERDTDNECNNVQSDEQLSERIQAEVRKAGPRHPDFTARAPDTDRGGAHAGRGQPPVAQEGPRRQEHANRAQQRK